MLQVFTLPLVADLTRLDWKLPKPQNPRHINVSIAVSLASTRAGASGRKVGVKYGVGVGGGWWVEHRAWVQLGASRGCWGVFALISENILPTFSGGGCGCSSLTGCHSGDKGTCLPFFFPSHFYNIFFFLAVWPLPLYYSLHFFSG